MGEVHENQAVYAIIAADLADPVVAQEAADRIAGAINVVLRERIFNFANRAGEEDKHDYWELVLKVVENCPRVHLRAFAAEAVDGQKQVRITVAIE